jgi:hypothetical protein
VATTHEKETDYLKEWLKRKFKITLPDFMKHLMELASND